MSAPTAVDPSAATQHPAPLRMSCAEWLAWDHDGLSEWINGEVIVRMPTKEEHQRVVDVLNRLLGLFVRALRLGVVRSAPFAMRALPDGPGREPDLFFLAEEHKERLTRHELAGPADLVVEAISDDSASRDRDEKFYEYQAAGVREYWTSTRVLVGCAPISTSSTRAVGIAPFRRMTTISIVRRCCPASGSMWSGCGVLIRIRSPRWGALWERSGS